MASITTASSPLQSEDSAPLWPPATKHHSGTLTILLDGAIQVPIPAGPDNVDALGLLREEPEWAIYAVLKCGLDKSSSAAGICWDAHKWRKRDDLNLVMRWERSEALHSFRVCEGSSKLTVHLLAHNRETAATVILCSVHTELDSTLSPSGGNSRSKQVDFQEGQGSFWFEYSFYPDRFPTLAHFFPEYKSKELAPGSFAYRKNDFDKKYAVVAVRSTVKSPVRINLLDVIKRRAVPFMNPVAFVYQPEKGLYYLSSPIPDGGNLFAHLQRERRFTEARAGTYTAELVYALEWLHSNEVVVSLRHENVMLDCYDHICLCVPAAFIAGADAAQSQAPELPSGLAGAETADWWAIGTFLYEMLTGMPPVLPATSRDERSKTMSWDLSFPTRLSVAAEDLLRMLLHPDAKKRIGSNGVYEIKAHPFFEGIVWTDLTDCEMRVLRPRGSDFMLNLQPRYLKREKKLVRKVSQGEVYEESNWFGFCSWSSIGRVLSRESVAARYPLSSSVAWAVEWEEAHRDFRFSNLSSGESSLAEDQAAACGLRGLARGNGKQDGPSPTGSSDDKPLPSTFQLKKALGIALELQCSRQVISQILDYGVDVNTEILDMEEMYDTYVMPLVQDPIPFTPLEVAVEQNRTDIVDLFLDRGADANFTVYPKRGPALVKAVLGRKTNLVRRLVGVTERSAATRALCLAIEQEDRESAEALLAAAVCCEYEESDWPSPEPDRGCTLGLRDPGLLKESAFTPPLARAVRLGNGELVRLLLAHGADANVAYHDLCLHHPHQHDYGLWLPVPEYSCGRPVQLAMELGFDDIAEQLIGAGADINLPQPSLGLKRNTLSRHVHSCPVVARSVHLDVTARLESAFRNRRNKMDSEE